MTTPALLADELLDALFDADPVSATVLGVPGRDHLVADYSEAGHDAVAARIRALAERAAALDPAGLSATDRITLAVVRQQAGAALDRFAGRGIEYTVTDLFVAPAAELLFLLPMVVIGDRARADAYLARLAALPRALRQIADRHRAGIAAGRLPVRRLVDNAVAHLDRYLANPQGDPLRRPEPADPDGFVEARDRLLADEVRPAFAAYRDVLATVVAPHGRPDDRAGLCFLPDGSDGYQRLIRGHTTTGRSADELHETGLAVIERLGDEYRELGARVFGTDELAAIFHRLRTDPALRWKDGDELLAAARTAIRRAERAAPDWFGRIPAQACTVEPVPADDAPGAPGAYYMQPAFDGSRPGVYFANTYQAQERDRYGAESVAFHEAVPGHHFQLTLAQELTDLPMLRRLGGFTAYAEGWGLYAERLADEMGLYSDDVARLGMLAEDSMRAARLVVDTGLHARGWSRQDVVDYMRANTAMPQLDIDVEADRYIADPGQALAYMVGRLEIQRIRADAERRLGARFDIRAFHDTVLGSGALPLDVLAEVVGTWVAGQLTAAG